MTLLTTSRRFWILRVFGKKELAKFTWLGSVRCFPRRGPFFERLGYLPDLEYFVNALAGIPGLPCGGVGVG